MLKLILNKTLCFLISTRIHVSILYALIVNGYCKGFGIPVDTLFLSVVLWHFGVYFFDRVHDIEIDAHNQKTELLNIKFKNLYYAIVALIFALSAGFYSIAGYDFWYFFLMIPLAFLYTKPMFGGKRIKQILIFKNVYSAAVIWCLPIYLIAYLYRGDALVGNDYFLTRLAGLFFSVLLIEAFWDIRDIKGDLINKVATIPNAFGINVARVYLVCLSFIVAWFTHITDPFVSMMLTLAVVIKEDSPKIHFHFPIFMLIIFYVSQW